MVLRGKFVAAQDTSKKKTRKIPNNLTLPLKELGKKKEEQTKPKLEESK